MENVKLFVEPEKLRDSAGNFENENTTIRNLTSDMMTIIEGTRSIWEGNASTAYWNKFRSLQSDMEQIDHKIAKYVSNIREIAQNYDTAEATNESEAGGLATDYIN